MEEKYVKLIINESIKAQNNGEVPVGCIIVKDNIVIAKAHNEIEKNKSIFDHAEIIAIKKAAKKLNNWRLNNCTMYVTLQPGKMCEQAIYLSRIKEVKYLLEKDNNNNNNSKVKETYLEKYSEQYKKIFKKFFSDIRS